MKIFNLKIWMIDRWKAVQNYYLSKQIYLEAANSLLVYACHHGVIGTIAMILTGKSYRDYVKNKFAQFLNCIPNSQVGVGKSDFYSKIKTLNDGISVNSSVVERSTAQPKVNQAGQQIQPAN